MKTPGSPEHRVDPASLRNSQSGGTRGVQDRGGEEGGLANRGVPHLQGSGDQGVHIRGDTHRGHQGGVVISTTWSPEIESAAIRAWPQNSIGGG